LSTSTIAVDTEFTSRDLDSSYEESESTQITLDGSNVTITGDGATESNGVITITAEGTYIFTGTLSDGQIVLEAADTDKVQIVLNGVTIHNSDSAAIYVKSADKVFITLAADTVNTLTDGSSYVQTDENTVDGVIFSKSDLTFNGTGTLNITATYKHAVVSKDDLVITGGTYNITAASDSLKSNDAIKISDGIIHIDSSNGQGITAKNDEDSTQGYVFISGGTINITNCTEGIEGTAIIIVGGTINITAQDDGFNASNGMASSAEMNADSNCYLSIAGGTITVNAQGDGLDSNGSIYVSGGTIMVSGPTNSGNGGMDYNGTAQITGGTIIVAGSTGMAQAFSDSSTQYSLLYNLTSTCSAGTEIVLTDSDGNVIASYTPDKEYQSVVISTPDMTNDATYTLTCGSQTADITLSSVVTSNGQTGMGGMGGMGGHGNGGGKGGW